MILYAEGERCICSSQIGQVTRRSRISTGPNTEWHRESRDRGYRTVQISQTPQAIRAMRFSLSAERTAFP
jgi:hypothetical protein